MAWFDVSTQAFITNPFHLYLTLNKAQISPIWTVKFCTHWILNCQNNNNNVFFTKPGRHNESVGRRLSDALLSFFIQTWDLQCKISLRTRS